MQGCQVSLLVGHLGNQDRKQVELQPVNLRTDSDSSRLTYIFIFLKLPPRDTLQHMLTFACLGSLMVIAVGAREVERAQGGKDPRSVHKMLMVPWATLTVWDKEMELAPFPPWKREGI